MLSRRPAFTVRSIRMLILTVSGSSIVNVPLAIFFSSRGRDGIWNFEVLIYTYLIGVQVLRASILNASSWISDKCNVRLYFDLFLRLIARYLV